MDFETPLGTHDTAAIIFFIFFSFSFSFPF
uniref:Uncharacterized protein n=1 Tax=Rhizophora mucronata TaxID=61149 RepID=A0A2P2QJ02_RHIMU